MLNYSGHCICNEGLSQNYIVHTFEISADVEEAQPILKLIPIHASPLPLPRLSTTMAYPSHSPRAATRVTPQYDD